MKKYIKLIAIVLVLSIILPGVVQAQSENNEEKIIRISGSTRVETSIEASKIAFKDTTSEYVILVGYNGEVDALTGTMLAGAKGAPLLITRKEALSEGVKEEIARLKAKTVYILGGETRVSKDVEIELEELYTVKRIAGKNREETAVAITKEVYDENRHVFLTQGYDVLADALSIGPVSYIRKRPVLLTKSNELSATSLNAMEELKVEDVTIIGGKKAISESIEDQLEEAGYEVDRIEGRDRYGTAYEIAEELFGYPENVMIANGNSTVDALIGGYFGGRITAPMILTRADRIPYISLKYVDRYSEKAYILGGTDVINESVLDEIRPWLVNSIK